MKAKALAITVMSIVALYATNSFADTTTVNGGSVHFKGEIVNAACAVDPNSVDQTVQMGQVRSTSLSAVDSTSQNVGFQIQLDDCDTTVSQTAAVAFSGVTIDDAHPTVLAVQGSAAGGAQNVGVQILDKSGTPLSLDGSGFSVPTNLINGTNIIAFQARYYSLGNATPGTANADATFQVQYQ